MFRQIGLASRSCRTAWRSPGTSWSSGGRASRPRSPPRAARFPKQTAIIDDLGEITWAELRDQINQLTHALNERGVEPGDSVAVLARNHRYIVMAMIAIMQAGGRVLLLNTMASGSQLTELADARGREVHHPRRGVPARRREGRPRPAAARPGRDRRPRHPERRRHPRGPADQGSRPSPRSPARSSSSRPARPGCPRARNARSRRASTRSVAFFGAIPYRGNSTIVLAAPLFHSWGLINFSFGLSTVPTYVMRRKFKADQVLERHRGAPGRGARGGAADDAAARRRRREAEQGRRVEPAHHRGERLGARRRARHHVHGHVHRLGLQLLRRHRDRMGHDRLARGPAGRAGHGRTSAVAHHRARSSTPTARRSRRARPAPSTSATTCRSAATPTATPRTSPTT